MARLLRVLPPLVLAVIVGASGVLAGPATAVTPPSSAEIPAAPTAPTAATLSGDQFDPGLIISDQIFFNPNGMTVDQIQSFLNARVPACAAGATCLKDYRQDTFTTGATPMCSQINGAPNQSAAQIIWTVAQACGVNPQVILVTLQKEQSLVTSPSPSAYAYRSAMGAGCPDTAACDSTYYGFFQQVRYGTSLYKRYTQPPGTGPGTAFDTRYDLRYPVGQYSNIQYKPGTACGTQSVLIKNQATHALYIYTPYVPNAAALANLGRTGDDCSSYGNRNFWYYFNTWFGSSILIPGATSFVNAAYLDVLGRGPSPADVDYWSSVLTVGGNRRSVANAFNNSDEYRGIRIREAYAVALGRDPDPDGFAYWLRLMQSGRVQPDDAYRTFLSSDELFNLAGGGTEEGYVTAVYQQILHRDPDPQGLAYWAGRLRGGEPRSSVADALYLSPETLNVRVNDTFLLFLGRPADLATQQHWSSVARTYGHTAMRSEIMASDEYWARASQRFPE